MPLRDRLQLPVLVQDLELAAEDRYYEGLELAARGYANGAVYLLGYVGEFLVKYSCLRRLGYRLQDDVRASFEPVREWSGQVLSVQASPESGHSIQYWMATLMAERNFQGDPLEPLTAQGLLCHAGRLHSHWRVEMRYLRTVCTQMELQEVIEDAGWLRAHFHELWG